MLFDGKFTRRVPKGKYAFDEVELNVSASSAPELAQALDNAKLEADRILPLYEADPGDDYHRSAEPATPGPALSSFDPTPGNPQLYNAERVKSPIGPSTGFPLGACSDEDLTFYATKYKKTGDGVKEAASIIRAARLMGQTHQKNPAELT